MIFINVIKNRLIEFSLKFIIIAQLFGLALGVSLIVLEFLGREDLIRDIIKIIL
jgi:hypothetical protein